jgi:hypothetical protein
VAAAARCSAWKAITGKKPTMNAIAASVVGATAPSNWWRAIMVTRTTMMRSTAPA